MALAVDSTGRVKASPVTGKPLKGTIADAVDEALKKDLEQTDGEQPGVSPGAANVSAIGSKLKAYQPTYGGMPYSQPVPQQASGMGISDQTWMPGPSNDEDLSEAAGLDIEWPVKPETVESGYWSPGPQRESSRQDGRTVSPDVLDYTGAAAKWEQDAAAREGREARTSNYWGEEYANTGTNIDPGLAYVGNTPTNDAYIRHFIENGDLTEAEAYDIMHNGPSFLDNLAETFGVPWLNSLAATVAAGRHARDREEPGPIDVPNIGGLDLLGNTWTDVDDGSSFDWDHLTADDMTGTQYKEYVEMGMGGRPVDEIVDSEKYNKRRESLFHGFVPFTPDAASYSNLVIGDIASLPGRIGSTAGNARQIFTPDYDISYGGQYVEVPWYEALPDMPWWEALAYAAMPNHDPNATVSVYRGGNTISGRDFDKRSDPFMEEIKRQQTLDPMAYMRYPDGYDGMPIISEYYIPDDDGNPRYAHGVFLDVEYDPLVLEFEDGQSVTIPSNEYETWPINPDTGGMMVPEDYMSEHGAIIDSMFGNGGDRPENAYFLFSDGQRLPVSIDRLDPNSENYVYRNNGLPMFRTTPENLHGDIPDLSTINDMDAIMANVEMYGGSPADYAAAFYYPNLTLSDGTVIPYPDVERLYSDTDKHDEWDDHSDDDIHYQFLPFDLNKPTRLTNPTNIRLKNPNGLAIDPRNWDFNAEDAGLNAFDWTLNSLPISVQRSWWNPWWYSISNGLGSLDGTNAGSYNPVTDSYSFNAGYYDDEGNFRYGITDAEGNVDERRSDKQRLYSSMGNFLVPLTEKIAGDIGSSPIDRAVRSVFRIPELAENPTLRNLLINRLLGGGGEAIEEVVGIPFEELTTYGPDAFADPIDIYGNPIPNRNAEGVARPMVDATGREIRAAGTPIPDRLGNFWEDQDEILNSYYGGLAVDLLMNIAGLGENGPLHSQIIDAARRDASRRNVDGNFTVGYTDGQIQGDGYIPIPVPQSLLVGLDDGTVVEDREDSDDDVPDDVRYVRVPDDHAREVM